MKNIYLKSFIKGAGNIGGSLSKNPDTFFRPIDPKSDIREAWLTTGNAIRKSINTVSKK